MKHLYGEFTQNQIALTKKSIKGSIFFLLLCVDENTKSNYPDVNVNQCFENLMYRIGGLNQLLNTPVEIVTVLSLLQSAYTEYNNPSFEFKRYRKLILDAGAEVDRISEEE